MSIKILFLLCILSNSAVIAQFYSLDLTYVQFETEILVIAEVSKNARVDDSLYTLRLKSRSEDLSNRVINSDQDFSIILKDTVPKSINLKTLEYTVLSKAGIIVDLFFQGEKLATDTLNLNFPNSFKKTNRGGNSDVEIDLGGLKIDRTRTPLGRSLYEQFEGIWEPPVGSSDFTIEFEELPFRFRTTVLKIYLNNEKVFETYLRDNKEFIDRIVIYLNSLIFQRLSEEKKRDDELGGNWNGI